MSIERVLESTSTQTDMKCTAEQSTDPREDYADLIKKAHAVMDEYNSMRFANDLMYQQMLENQRVHKEELDKIKQDNKSAE